MIDLDDIQRLVVRPPRADAMTIDFVHADSKRDLRTFFRSAVGAVTVATDRPAVTVTVGVASAGLRLAGIDRRAHDALTPAFRSGMRHAASALGDVGDSDPAHWIAPFDGASDEVHAVVIRQHDLGATFPPLAGGRTVARWTGARRPADDEPFGFADGITDPVIAGSGKELRLGNGVWDPTRRAWRPVA
ncbi:MAG TPA: hypothetical protein VEA78_12265, partial [Acidimicrobiales bacterium]|nr:hypothetical protein [Acidimicrobiales bacterium]